MKTREVKLPPGEALGRSHPRAAICYRDAGRCAHYMESCLSELGDWNPKCRNGELYEPEPEEPVRRKAVKPFGEINLPTRL